MRDEDELIREIALMFFDTMSVPCIPTSYAIAVIKKVREHDMKKVGDVVNELVRNEAASLGLEYPYVFAHNLEQYLIWHRDTGEIVWVGEEGLLGSLGYQAAWKKAEELNGLNPYRRTDPQVLSDIDSQE